MVLRMNARFFRKEAEIRPAIQETLQLIDSHENLLGKTAVIVGEGYIGKQKVYVAEFPDALPTLSIPSADDDDAVCCRTLVQIQPET